MKKLLATALFTCIRFFSLSQTPELKFGEIPMEDMSMSIYPQDSSAVAYTLYDYGESIMVSDGYFYRHSRIKILKNAGLYLANIAIPVQGNLKSIANFKASTFNLVGNKIEETKLEGSGIFKEEIVDGLEVLKFAMPNVKEGSVIEYTYKILSGGVVNWEFQSFVPQKYSEYKVMAPNLIDLNVFTQGYLVPSYYNKGDIYSGDTRCTTYHWVMESIPAFKPEPFISSYKNYLSKVTFAIAAINYVGYHQIDVMTDWETFRANYRNAIFFEKKLRGSGFLTKIVKDVTKNCNTNSEKVLALYYFVKKQMEWDGRNSIFPGENIKAAYDKKTGHSGEINLILLGMLQSAGINAEPVLISTRDHGFARPEVVSMSQFNKVIVWTDMDGKFILLDATDKYLPYDFLPENCINGLGKGFRAGESSFQWIPFHDINKTKIAINVKTEIQKDGLLTGKLSIAKSGYAAREVRKKLRSNNKEEYLKETFPAEMEFVSNTFENVDTLTSQTTENHEFILHNYSQVVDDKIYLNPILLSRVIENPFKSETREYPIDFGFTKEITYSARIKIPEGYTVDELPKQTLSVLPQGAGKFLYSCVPGAGEIIVTTQVILYQSFFSQSEYALLKEFYNIITAKHADQIVLKKD